MAKLMRSFRLKMIVLLGLSMILSGLVTYIVYKALQLYYRSSVQRDDPLADIRHLIKSIGDFNSFLLLFIPLSIMFFFILTARYEVYFQKISSGIHHLANGDFTKRVSVDSNDEFADIARDINLAGEKLQKAVERGDFAESSKDRLVLNLAHDLRTPLTSVLGYLDFMLRDRDLSMEQIKHYAAIAYTKSQRLEKLIDELFEITRMNYGNLSIEKKPIDLSELLIQIDEMMYPLFEKNQLAAKINVTPHLHIEGDGDLLARVFENLLTNAVRYGKDGQFVEINGFADAGEVVAQVVNYGDAIPEKDLPHLFELFYTGDQARSHQGGSSGLGLFIAKNIVEQHNGSISVQSSVIRTIFEVRIPSKA
ncbi:HAMP domain-containing sensor histidine kinase [Paenibacillus thalictri]|uniref:histidine kinase n=1 Tax=Paenibacillus thalictri TaxID=2527873 RepID=A0A4Q9DSK3_9BACL|nr:HAMP domain-containing sensor histidine kinase [Paenibacillus thalictri]TBL77312.1 HAMP domain-containing histidine kinase [Paenibacillus thalictri]